MKTAAFFVLVIRMAWALPGISKGIEDLQFKRLYVDPLIPPDELIPRIVNGHEVPPHSIPSQAFIVIHGPLSWLCGGSLISPKFVLTAAHCLIGGFRAQVYLGAHNLDLEEPTRVFITSHNLIPHEDYEGSTISNDIGLIEFSAPIELSAEINIVSLARRGGVDDYAGLLGRVSGWGLTAAVGDVSSVLLALNSTIITNRLCNTYFEIVQEYQVCISGAQGGGTCHGDSGNPLVVGNVQIGVASYGSADCLTGYPSAFTRTDYFLDWIEKHTSLLF